MSLRRLAFLVLLACGAIGAAALEPGIIAAEEPAGNAEGVPPPEASAKPFAAADWDRLAAAWMRQDSLESQPGLDLARWAELDSTHQELCDSLRDALLSSSELPTAGLGFQLRRVLLDEWARGQTALTGVLTSGWSAERAAGWNRDGRLTVPAAVLLLAEGRFDSALSWLASARATAGPTQAEPVVDIEYVLPLLVEARLALADTAAAGEDARAGLARHGAHLPSWSRFDLEEASILSRLASGDTSSARREIASYNGEERGFRLLAQSRLAALRGDVTRAESLRWRVVVEYPAGRTAERLLRALVPGDGTVPELSADEARALLAVAEKRGDLPRFRALEQSLRARCSTTSSARDSLAVRGGRLAFRTKDYDLLLRLDASGEWRPQAPFAVEWSLITARAFRNTGQADSMARRYRLSTRRGGPEDRATAYWEWAREMEALRRFQEADTLYGSAIAAGAGENRVSAMLRRGICRFGMRDWAGARKRMERAAAAGDSEDRAFAWFWIYRAETALGRSDAARAALAEAARDKAGYYGRRAASALALSSRPGGASVLDPTAFWGALHAIGRDPDLARAGDDSLPQRVLPRLGDPVPRSPEDGAVENALGRLLLFRLGRRADWLAQPATAVREGLDRGAHWTIGQRLIEVSAPDLAARAAVRAGGSIERRYPRPYPAEVAAAARRFSLAPEWIWAVMRRESFFESGVVSGAGATGLMQLMDATARATAERHGLPAGRLGSPRVNVFLGAAHLADLLAEEPDRWPIVLAAYNASLANARRWAREEEDPDFYIEMIGYRETREYVRRVLEGFWVYRSLLRQE